MSELKPCPFCGAMPTKLNSGYMCSTLGCALQENTVSAKEWNTRPIEDALNARIVELEAERRWIPVSERLPEESGWYRVGAINVYYEGYTDEVYFDADKNKLGWQSSVRDKVYCWLDGVPELPQPLEVQE